MAQYPDEHVLGKHESDVTSNVAPSGAAPVHGWFHGWLEEIRSLATKLDAKRAASLPQMAEEDSWFPEDNLFEETEWFKKIEFLATELDSEITRVLNTLQTAEEETNQAIESAKEYAQELVESFSQRLKAAFSDFVNNHAGSELIRVIEEAIEVEESYERDIENGSGQAMQIPERVQRVQEQVRQVEALREQQSRTRARINHTEYRISKLDEKLDETTMQTIGLLMGFIVCCTSCFGIYNYLYRGPGDLTSSVLVSMSFALGVAVYYIIRGLPVILRHSLKQDLARLNEEAARLEAEINKTLESMKSTLDELISLLRFYVDKTVEFASTEAINGLKAFSERTTQKFRSWLDGWKERANRIRQEMEKYPEMAPWSAWTQWSDWQPVNEPRKYLRLGEWERKVDVPGVPQERVSLPALVQFRWNPGIMFFASDHQDRRRVEAVQSLGFRLLASVPPGKLRFSFIDPVKLGQSVASLLHLKDFDESEEDSLVGSRAWVDAEHIRKHLLSLKDHIATVTQERLRDQYRDIEEYNSEAGEVAVPYRILMVFDFPANFSNEMAETLLSIAQTGSRVGVFTIVLLDENRKLPYDSETIKKLMHVLSKPGRQGWFLWLDEVPPEQVRSLIIREWGSRAKEGMKVEVPFAKLLDMSQCYPDRWWSASAGDVLEIPLGPITARKPQNLVLGKGTANHALIVGRTGSGKSNLMHVIISAAALKYSPQELRMYLIDLKTVEFSAYRELPHAEAVAVDADREFALSILKGLDREMLRRMELFRGVANDLAEYRDKTGNALPRILLLVDEFQVLFEQDDNVSMESSRLLDRLVRQGRAFGIHVILGSQSLAGHSLPRATLDQMAVRIALQCSEADSRLILAEDNPAARRLSRPGQAIYNSMNGLIEGNTEFQVALFDDRDREEYIRLIADQWKEPRPLVFQGNEPAHLEACAPLRERLKAGPLSSLRWVDTWIGEPVSMDPPVTVRWSRRSGDHLVVVTREEEEGVSVLMSVAIGLCVQYPSDRLRLYIADFSTPDSEWAEIPEVLQTIFPQQVQVLGRRELLQVLSQLQQIVEGEQVPREDHYLLLVGLHRIRDLRPTDELDFRLGADAAPQPSEQLMTILRDGPEAGVHVLIWCDTVGNLQRSLDRRALREIGLRVAGPMSEQDSMQLLDSPVASRLDKPHRMIFHNDAEPGKLQKFRPYVVQNLTWLQTLASS
jgi:S-DNA-T family DNA segregation ATPase FtsK/SpoIIIE